MSEQTQGLQAKARHNGHRDYGGEPVGMSRILVERFATAPLRHMRADRTRRVELVETQALSCLDF